MKSIAKFLAAQLAVVVLAVTAISLTFIYATPRVYGVVPAIVLLGCLTFVAYASGWLVSRRLAVAPLRRYSLVVATGVAMTTATFLISLFFILNARGS